MKKGGWRVVDFCWKDWGKVDFWWRRIRISDCYTGKRATTGLDDDIEGTGLDGKGRDEKEG